MDNREYARYFLFDLLNAHRTYHHSKERMALTGIVLHIGVFGTALISGNWPPTWIVCSQNWQFAITIAAISVAWLLVLVFVKWQLRLRRWAALHVAGTQRLLASWITNPPSDNDLKPWIGQKMSQPRLFLRLLDYVWAHQSVTIKKYDVTNEAYPSALVKEWIKQEETIGTGAIFHERLVVVVGWLFYLALLARTIA